MKIRIIVCSFFLLLGCYQSDPDRPPNIILFLVDDLGWQDTSVPFHESETPLNKRFHTPNMERLAAQGMKFTNAYAACVCSPSRISLMTGMNAARHRVTNWTLKKNIMSDGNDPIIQPPNWNYNGLNTEPGINNTVAATTLPSLLQQGGYFTIHVGKAHFAALETPCADPLNCGFDVNIAGHAAGAPGSYNGKTYFGNHPSGKAKGNWSVPGLEKYHGQDINLTEVLTRESLNVLDTVIRKDKPFYLYLSHYTVHTPIQADHRFFEKYLDRGLDTIEARYASMVEGMDKSLGDVMDYLEKKKLADDTIILFMSDNGGLSAVARSGERHKHNAPLASGKGSAYEGGVREPMIVKWPKNVGSGTVSHEPLIIEDFFPTILEIAGQDDAHVTQEIDGQSFVNILQNGDVSTDGERPLFWHYPNIWGPEGDGIGAYSAVRQGKWKLIYFHKDSSFELYDLEKDIGESENLFLAEVATSTFLAKTLSAYLRSVGAQMPLNKDTNEVVLWPDEVL